MPGKFIFTITTGRSGTLYLAKLLRENVPEIEAHHEFVEYDSFGVDTPDLSDLMQFNAFGTTAKVRDFWDQKLSRISTSTSPIYAETSHVLSKAGLLENISGLETKAEVLIILLRRSTEKVVASLAARNDLSNKSSAWLWYLDPAYPRNIVNSRGFLDLGLTGVRIWYVYEMMTRAEYYRLLLANHSKVRFIDVELENLTEPQFVSEFLSQIGCQCLPRDVTIPAPQNASPQAHDRLELKAAKDTVEQIPFSPRALATKFLDAGRRIGTPDGTDGKTELASGTTMCEQVERELSAK